jgi:hypothetical protein
MLDARRVVRTSGPPCSMAISSAVMPSGAKISPRSGSVRSQGLNVVLKSGSSWILASHASGEGCEDSASGEVFATGHSDNVEQAGAGA